MEPTLLAPLFAALVLARAEARAVEKDKTNSFHKYDYASAEAILKEAGYLLSKNGLHVIPASTHVDPTLFDAPAPKGGKSKKPVRRGDDGEELPDDASPAAGTIKILYLRRKYMLVHQSGAWTEMVQDWAIVPEAGRPMDKAIAGAVTASLGYFLRDLLLLPRVDEADDLDSPRRDERREPETKVETRREEVRREPEARREEPRQEARREEPREEPKPQEKKAEPAKEQGPKKDPRDAIVEEVTSRIANIDRDAAPPIPSEVGKLIYDLVKIELPELTDEQAENILGKLQNTPDKRLLELFIAANVPF